MNNILQCIRDEIGAEHCPPSCSKDRCKVDLKGTPSPYLIVDPESKSKQGKDPANHSPNNNKKCDLIFFFQNSDGNLVIVPLELKTGEVKATPVRDQLQAGVCFAERIIPKSCHPACQPILFHSGNLHKLQRTELNRAKIRLPGSSVDDSDSQMRPAGQLGKRTV